MPGTREHATVLKYETAQDLREALARDTSSWNCPDESEETKEINRTGYDSCCRVLNADMAQATIGCSFPHSGQIQHASLTAATVSESDSLLTGQQVTSLASSSGAEQKHKENSKNVLAMDTKKVTDEWNRLLVLKSYLILDTTKESSFDRITAKAVESCSVPWACISLVDMGRAWFKSVACGASEPWPNMDLQQGKQAARKDAFCSYAIRSANADSPRVVQIKNCSEDSQFANHPMVVGAPYYRFYAAAPLIVPEGYCLGTLCVLDTKPRSEGLSIDQQMSLLTLADQAVNLLVHRREKKQEALNKMRKQLKRTASDAQVVRDPTSSSLDGLSVRCEHPFVSNNNGHGKTKGQTGVSRSRSAYAAAAADAAADANPRNQARDELRTVRSSPSFTNMMLAEVSPSVLTVPFAPEQQQEGKKSRTGSIAGGSSMMCDDLVTNAWALPPVVPDSAQETSDSPNAQSKRLADASGSSTTSAAMIASTEPVPPDNNAAVQGVNPTARSQDSPAANSLSPGTVIDKDNLEEDDRNESSGSSMDTIPRPILCAQKDLPDPKAMVGVDPDKYLLQLIEAMYGVKLKIKPALELYDYFPVITEQQMAAYSMQVVSITRSNDVAKLREFYEQNGRDSLDCFNRFGEGLLNMACRRGFKEIVEFLLSPDIALNVRIRDDYGRTPMHDACWNAEPQLEICAWVMKLDPSLFLITDKRGYTPFQYARKSDWHIWRQFLYDRREYLEALVTRTDILNNFAATTMKS